MVLAYGVIGNTADFGSVVQGSSPCRPTDELNCLHLQYNSKDDEGTAVPSFIKLYVAQAEG